MKRALILANGEWEGNEEFFHRLRKNVETLVCADGGAEYALQLGLKPDGIFGDLDSLSEKSKARYEMMGINFVLFPVEKDKTDTHLVLDYLIDEGYDEIIIGGALGGRPDHLLGNMMLLSYGFRRGVKVKLLSPTVEICVIQGEMLIDGHVGDTFSLIPIEQSVQVTLEGFKYPLSNVEVARESTLGVSNIILKDQARVLVQRGSAFIFIIKKQIV